MEQTQEQLDKLRNLTWQNGKLVELVEQLIKQLEGKDDSALIAEIKEAKRMLAAAINTKGGSSSGDESFTQLADDIRQLSESGILATGIEQTEPFSFLKYITISGDFNITAINSDAIFSITRSFAFYSLKSLSYFNAPNLTTITGNNCFDLCILLSYFNAPNLTTITGSACFGNCFALRELNIPKLTILNSTSFFYNTDNLENIIMGTLTTFNYGSSSNKPLLRNFTIGQDTDINLSNQYWTATDVIAEGQSGIEELNSNLYNNLLTKLYDHSQDGQTRTLRLGWLAHVSQENIDYANAKGWTLTT